ncbi:MAG: lipid-binding protein [Proteiniphilum sp.]|jgi:hypothetical protein|nr:lipid-binding protein [Proteiniphilum sp.]MDD2937235.1 lipid-binding protein [Proteiniphilum sp.]MDD3076480.1 lipid-binding protein [Proteiniphilum sp.]MDD3778926.1 lipid-binding protein [Proteiniphilum sp.]MDD3956379.1 lipid-binding protein [Proteiniphilum sp.]
MKKVIYLLGLITLVSIVSCEREETSESINMVNLTGKWEVNAYLDSTLIFGPFMVNTLQSTSSTGDSITIWDSETKFWDFQVKASTQGEEGTFETELSKCQTSEKAIGIKIFNGKMQSNSIYFEIQFEDDLIPYGQTYRLKGHRV